MKRQDIEPVRELLHHELDVARRVLEGEIDSLAGQRYWGGYWDATRHALKLLPPHVVWAEEGDWAEWEESR